MGGVGAIAEPLVVVFLLFGGAWINRNSYPISRGPLGDSRRSSQDDVEAGTVGALQKEGLLRKSESRPASPSLSPEQEPVYRSRTLKILGLRAQVSTPNTRRFKTYFLSRLLDRFPFLVECWYWALIYWVYQLGRAATAVWIVEGTIHRAELHALDVIDLEKRLHIFWEVPIQQYFMKNELLMTWINRVYSFIHIPGSIAFLVWLFYYTNTRPRNQIMRENRSLEEISHVPAGPKIYESRRRTMAFCNLLAFIIFTFWPCMPPRLLSADKSDTVIGYLARSHGFVDTVHGPGGEGSIWTDNRFTNKFAAMPSLHFGYSLLIGLTIATIPFEPGQSTKSMILPFFNRSHPKLAPKVKFLSAKRLACIAVGIFYPALILVAIIATANHFILDAVAGSIVCGVAWWGNDVLLNLLIVEDWFLWCVRIHKPVHVVLEEDGHGRIYAKGALEH